MEGNYASGIFENPYNNNVTGDEQQTALFSSFDNDEADSFDDEVVVTGGGHFRESSVDDRLDNAGNEDHIDESLFTEGVSLALNPGANVQARNLSIPRRIVNIIDMVTTNSLGRRWLHRILPDYIPLSANQGYHGQVVGNGLQNDGVFSNMMAKPTALQETTDDLPPTYEEAAADATPPYWESTVFSPYGDGVFVDGLPVGNIVNFVWNLMVSSAFQFVGFLLTYLLHTSHAAKEGSRAGLGITFISYGYYMIPDNHFFRNFKTTGANGVNDAKFEPYSPNDIDVDFNNALEGSIDDYTSSLNDNAGASDPAANGESAYFDENSAPIFAYGLVALGVFIFIKSLLDYHRAKQMEKVILQSPSFERELEEV